MYPFSELHLQIDNLSCQTIAIVFYIRSNMASPVDAQAAANFYSLIATCNTNNIEPYKYFKVMFDKIRYCNNDTDLRSLLPHNTVL